MREFLLQLPNLTKFAEESGLSRNTLKQLISAHEHKIATINKSDSYNS